MKVKIHTTTETILGIVTGFMILFWWIEHKWLLYIAIAIGLTGIFIKPLARQIVRAWMFLAKCFGYFNSRVILGIVFFLILTPLAIVARLGRKDPLNLKGKGNTFYKIREHQYNKEDLENPW